MKGLAAFFGEARSLRRRLVVNILLAFGFCFALASVILILEFYEHLENNRKAALALEAAEVAAQIRPDAPDMGLDANALRFRGDGGRYRYTVFDADMQPIVGGEAADGLTDMISVASTGLPLFVEFGDMRAGAALAVEREGQRLVVLVSTAVQPGGGTHLSELLHEVMEEIRWVVIGIAVILSAAVLAANRALLPLSRISREAEAIGPGSTDKRLSTGQLPTEIVPLVHAVNEAFDRLDQGYRAQRDFSSNVAHEIRTPLAVLRSAIDRMDEGRLKCDLHQDVLRLEQMFEQIIDLSRAEALGVTAFDDVDLRQIALAIAEEKGVAALREGKRLAVTGAQSVTVKGQAGLLAIALDNLLRNAINHTDGPGEIEIEVTDNPAGWRVLDRGAGIPDAQKSSLFQRFRRGSADGHDGAGIGLAIVKSVAEAHGAVAMAEDREGGGSIFSILFTST